MPDSFYALLESPISALVVCLLLGAVAMSGKFSQFAAHLCLAGACIVGASGIFRAAAHQPRLSFGGVLMLIGFCLMTSHWIKPPIVNITSPPLPTPPFPPSIALDKPTEVPHETPHGSPKVTPAPVLRVSTPRLHEGTDDPFVEFQNDQLTAWGKPMLDGLRTALAQYYAGKIKNLEWRHKEIPRQDDMPYLVREIGNNDEINRIYKKHYSSLKIYRAELVKRVPGGDTSGNANQLDDALNLTITMSTTISSIHFEIEEILKDFGDLTQRLSDSDKAKK